MTIQFGNVSNLADPTALKRLGTVPRFGSKDNADETETETQSTDNTSSVEEEDTVSFDKSTEETDESEQTKETDKTEQKKPGLGVMIMSFIAKLLGVEPAPGEESWVAILRGVALKMQIPVKPEDGAGHIIMGIIGKIIQFAVPGMATNPGTKTDAK